MSKRVGSAHIDVDASTARFQKALATLITEAEAAGTKAGDSFSDNFNDKVDKAADQLESRMATAFGKVVATADEASRDVGRSIRGMVTSGDLSRVVGNLRGIRDAIDDMGDEASEAAVEVAAADKSVDRLGNSAFKATRFIANAEGEIEDLARKALVLYDPVFAASQALDEMGDEAQEADRKTGRLSRAMGLLGTTALIAARGVDRGASGLASWARNAILAKTGTDSLRKSMVKMGNQALISSAKVVTGATFMKAAADKMRTSWARMDNTVRFVIGAIVIAAGPLTVLISKLSAAMVALVAVLGSAVAGLGAMLALVAPAGAALAAMITGLVNLDDYSAAAARSFGNLKDSFLDTAVPAFMGEWTDSLEDFADSLGRFVDGDMFKSLGVAMSEVTDSITNALNSDAATRFLDVMAGPLSEALGAFGSAFGPLIEVLLNTIVAATPAVLSMSEAFRGWAENLAAVTNADEWMGEMTTFFQEGAQSLELLLDLVGELWGALGGVLGAGLPTGQAFLLLLTGLTEEFNIWANSWTGQNSMRKWFESLFEVVEPLFDAIGSLASSLASLITPDVVAQTADFLDGLAEIFPILADLLSIVGEANIINLLTEAIHLLGAAIEPLIDPLSQFLSIISDELSGVMEALEDPLVRLTTALGPLLDAISPLIPMLGDLMVTAITAFTDALAGLLEDETFLEDMTTLIDAINEALTVLIDSGLLEATAGLAVSLVPVLAELITLLAETVVTLTPAFESIAEIFETLSTAIETHRDEITLAFDAIQMRLEPFVAIVTSLFGGLAALFRGDWSEAFREFGNVFIGVLNAVWDHLSVWVYLATTAITGVVDWWSGKVEEALLSLEGFIERTGENVDNFLETINVSEEVREIVDNIFSWFAELPTRIFDALSGIGSIVTNAMSGFSIGGLNFNLPQFAEGTIAHGPTPGIFGEAGSEALVPLDRPLSQVDPSVRALSAIAQGKVPGFASGGVVAKGGVTIESGAFNIITPSTDAEQVASSVMDRLVSQYA